MKKTSATKAIFAKWITFTLFVPLFVGNLSAQLACNNQVNASVSPTPNVCEVEINADMILEAPDPNATYFIEIHDGLIPVVSGLSPVVIFGASAYFGSTLTATVTDVATNISCWGNLIVEDKLGPEITCQNVSVNCADDLEEVVPFPIAVDNCDLDPDIQLTNEVINTSTQCVPGFVTITRTYVAHDNEANTSAPCNQVITINRPNEIDFPDDIIWTCDQYNAFPNITGPEKLHEFITDTDNTSASVIDVNLDETCDDEDLNPNPNCGGGIFDDDDEDKNSTNIANGGTGCPGNACNFPNNGLDDADVLEITGSGIPEEIDGIYCLYNYSLSDATLSSCGNSLKIIRTWTVLDWCTGQVITGNSSGEDNVQVIKVMDKVAPVIAPIGPLQVSANNPGFHPLPCTSTGFLPAPDVSDNCNATSFKIFTPVGEVIYISGGGLIPSPGLPQGTHTITYHAEDLCGNITIVTTTVEVVDNLAPAAICDEITDVNLTSDGYAHVPAETFDDGSFDNCCLDHFEVARMDPGCGSGTAFGPTITFCCDDISNNPNMVIFRVFDCDGNYNDCMVQAYVQDKLPPILISCPGSQTITCDFYLDELKTSLDLGDYSVLDQFGSPIFQDNCEYAITENVNINIDQCGAGTITRTWQATDPSGNGPTTCTQIIFVRHVSDWVVEFPADITVTCTEELPEIGEPEITDETCELIAVSYEDEIFNVVTDACYKIVRTWSVINWCVVGANVDEEAKEKPENQLGLPFPVCDLDNDGDCDERTFRDSWNGVNFPGAANAGLDGPPDTDPDLNPWDGYIEYQQIAKVIDNVAPIFPNDCIMGDVCILNNTCGATVELPVPDIQDCSSEVTITAESDLGNGFGPFFNVAPGTYTVTYSAMDNCGNSNACQSTLTVLDCKKPTPLCDNGLVIELMPGTNPPMVTIKAIDFDEGSWDNCPGTLKFSFSSDVSDTVRTYGCNEVGQQNVEIWVTDAAGNQDYCSTFVIVQDNMAGCGDPLVVNVGGAIATEENVSVSEVTVELSGQSNATVYTDENGEYTFTNVPLGNDVTITPGKDIDPLNGVTTFDLVLITKHILAVQKLDSPYKIIAADANKTESVTTADLVVLRKLILNIDDDFANNTSWRFVDGDFEFPNPENPFETSFPEIVNINNIPNDVLNADFIAVKVGDVNNSANFVSLEDRNKEAFVLNTHDLPIKAGEQYTIGFRADDMDILGYQFTLNFDKNALEFVNLIPAMAREENFGFTLLDQGAITASWNVPGTGAEIPAGKVFALVFNAKTNGKLNDLLNINSRFTTAEAYNPAGDLMDVELTFNGAQNTAFELYQNTPNPYKGVTTIGFNLPEDGEASLTVQDVNGRVIHVVNDVFAKGYNEVNLDANDLPASGVLYYSLKTANNNSTKKMIVIK